MKKIFLRFLSVLLALQGFAAAQLLTVQKAEASEAPGIVINEVMWMGSTADMGDSGDEWIELFNPSTTETINLNGWTLANIRSGVEPDYNWTTDLEILPGEYALVGQVPVDTALSVALDEVISSFSLSDPPGCVVIELRNQLDELIDSMDCNGDGTYFGGENTSTKRSLERNVEIADGAMPTSWHTSVGFKNLVVGAAPNNFATPKFVNDETPADTTAALVNDGLANDVNWSNDPTTANANWSGFADLESGLTGEYAVELLDSLDNVVISDIVTDTNVMFDSLSLTEGEEYHFTVSAMNNVGLESLVVESDGFTINTMAPDPASNLTVADVPGDNGGSVLIKWDASTSIDEISYRVDYNKVGDATVLSQNAGSLLEIVINGLENEPVAYNFTVVATDFSALDSSGNPTAQGSAEDNLAPVLDPTKVVVDQNKPGSSDMIRGLDGVSSESATVTVFNRDPSDPAKLILASVLTTAGNGFSAVSIGDNLYGNVWVQLVDGSGNASAAVKFTNDIVGPNAVTITDAIATCQSERCQIEINWMAVSDAVEYRVEYGSGVERTLSLPTSNRTLILNLAADGSFQDFVVYGYDQFGNRSAVSQHFLASLVPGVITIATLIDGQLVTRTLAVEGARETIQAAEESSVPAKLVPAAQAAEPEPATDETAVAGSQDWLRIFIVVVLLLIVAGGFYSLSRSMQKSSLDIPKEKPKTKAQAVAGKAAKKTKRPRRRRSGK